MAATRILNDPVHDAVEGIAGGDGGVGPRLELGRRDGAAEVLEHHDLGPELCGNEAVPVEGRRAGEDPVVGLRQRLLLLMTLPPTCRAARPVSTGRGAAVIRLGDGRAPVVKSLVSPQFSVLSGLSARGSLARGISGESRLVTGTRPGRACRDRGG